MNELKGETPTTRVLRTDLFRCGIVTLPLAICLILFVGCARGPSKDEDGFSSAKATAAVAFAEAELAFLSQKPSAAANEAASPETPPRSRRLLYFTATWCPNCRLNEPTLAALAARGWRIGRDGICHIQVIDVDRHPELASACRIDAVPAWVLLDGEIVVSKRTGFLDPFAVGRMFETQLDR